MAHRFLISQDSPSLYITIVTKNRLRVFKTNQMKEILCSAIGEAGKSGGFLLFAYVIMLDHMHLLTSRPSTNSDVLRFLKGITAHYRQKSISFLQSLPLEIYLNPAVTPLNLLQSEGHAASNLHQIRESLSLENLLQHPRNTAAGQSGPGD